MELDAFNSELGLSQGRLCRENDGCAFILGSNRSGRYHELTRGDYAIIEQDADLTGMDLVRTELEITVPEGLPPSLAWEVSILVDGAPSASVKCTGGERRTITDLAAEVSRLSGVHTVGLRLLLTSFQDM